MKEESVKFVSRSPTKGPPSLNRVVFIIEDWGERTVDFNFILSSLIGDRRFRPCFAGIEVVV